MSKKDAIVVGLCFLAMIILGSFLLLLDPTVHMRFLEAIDAIGRACEILFGAAVLLGSAAIGVKIWKMASSHTVRDGRDGQIARAVIYKGTVVQLGSAEGFGLNELLQMQGQLITQQEKTLRVVDSGARAVQRLLPLLDDEGEEEEQEGLLQIEAPRVYTLSQQLACGQTSLNEETSLVGYVEDEPLRGKLFDDDGNMFDSVFVFGDQGFGKSTFATYLAALTVLHHGRLIVIDPDAEFGQSLSVRLGPLANEIFLLCPIVDTPQKASRAISLARNEIESPSEYPILWLIDEFSMIARQASTGSGQWSEVGKSIIELAEDYATRGRKRRRRVICFGQIPKATRAGGTELRDSMTTVAFHLKRKRAQMVLDEEAEMAPDLGPGEVIVVPARSSEASYRMQLPMPDRDGLVQVVRTMAKLALEASADGSVYVKLEPSGTPLAPFQHPSSTPYEPFVIDHETAFKVKVQRIREMRAQNKNQEQIIEAIYGVKKGGNAKYATARDEYLSIVQLLASTEGEI